MRARLCCRIAARLAPATVLVAMAVNGIHAVVHGTPLDGGMLDGLVANFNMLAAYLTATGAQE